MAAEQQPYNNQGAKYVLHEQHVIHHASRFHCKTTWQHQYININITFGLAHRFLLFTLLLEIMDGVKSFKKTSLLKASFTGKRRLGKIDAHLRFAGSQIKTQKSSKLHNTNTFSMNEQTYNEIGYFKTDTLRPLWATQLRCQDYNWLDGSDRIHTWQKL